MNSKYTSLLGIVLITIAITAGCNTSAEESNGTDNTEQNHSSNQASPDSNHTSSPTDALEEETDRDTSDSDTIVQKNNPNTAGKIEEKSDEETGNSTNNIQSLKEEYLEKLYKTKKETDKIRKESEDDITYALKKVEGDRYDVWDGLLNEIYGILEVQLSTKEMEALRVEQREWLEYRDNTAKEASLVYENGTMEQLEYVTVQNNLTEERCFQLVEEYMK
ncbi:lysozyme inhibitor LprI family protein [Oceanobacillus kimchii]|uniref:lysozyme inhibitor LprI family protein n=1 Tax=Oceanobacillus TaxID=182709 RepID=UPI00034C3A08|nr:MULTISPECIES: lysozyme inhibitor LprI family protein [Oceanobacillus]MCT1577786.1 lysozyme inhibitor LprI family protein [Oceanobacillus kimchii]MCT2136774.1 lysozyme inhibitor LprI family protein [Oceanobacillus kimchii]OEH53902.1 hypothetical protein AQ616_15615 [Oceanobacillus sp. E9]